MPFENHRVPLLGAPATVIGMTIVVVVECAQCEAGEQLALVNAQPAICPHCGASVSLDRVSWDKQQPAPKIELSATRPMSQAFQ